MSPLAGEAAILHADAEGWRAARAMVPDVRTLAPRLAVAGLLPLVAYLVLRPSLPSDAVALLVVMAIPLVDVVVERVRTGRLEPVGLIAVAGILLGAAAAVVSPGSALVLKLRESAITGVFGLVCIASLPLARPAIFVLGRAFAEQQDPARVPAIDLLCCTASGRRRFRAITALWGAGLIAETAVRVCIALAAPTSAFLALAPVSGWVVLGGLLVITARLLERWSVLAGRAAAAARVSEWARGTTAPGA